MTRYASAARVDGLFAEARRAWTVQALVESRGGKLRKVGGELRGACILCGAGQGNRSVFRIKGERWKCFGCDLGGDVVDLAAELRGERNLVEAARWLLGRDAGSAPARPFERAAMPEPSGTTTSEKVALEILRGARPFAGTLAETYLRRRGVAPEVLALAADNLRFHPDAKHSWDSGARRWVTAPALVLPVVTPAGPTGGAHVTYLDRATAGKAALEPAKRMWGPQNDSAGRPGGAWLIGPVGDGDLVVAEGVETGLSVVTLAHRSGLPMRCLAALALGRLQGGWLRDDEGCIDPFRVTPDPARPAFTWPAPADAPWGEVRIAVDRDMGEVKVKARTGRGRICSFSLDSEARARICGRLAVAAWKAAGAAKARAIAPPPNSDFNDELRRQLARERDQ